MPFRHFCSSCAEPIIAEADGSAPEGTRGNFCAAFARLKQYWTLALIVAMPLALAACPTHTHSHG